MAYQQLENIARTKKGRQDILKKLNDKFGKESPLTTSLAK
jgi:hypothetical protein